MRMLTEGDTLPDLTLLDDRGIRVSTHDLLGKGNVVMWFYPKDDTPG